MVKRNRTLINTVLILLIFSVFMTATWQPIRAAQTGGNPLMDMLVLVPAYAAEVGAIPRISFVDYRALEAARPDVPAYESWAEFVSQDEANKAARSIWIANNQRLQSGLDSIRSANAQLGEMPAVMGFDLFDVDRSLVYGFPGTQGVILSGEFDSAAIATAHTARNYTSTDQNGVVLWCGSVGCENGARNDPAKQNFANLFGGALGREEPFALIAGYILNSLDLLALQTLIAVYQGEQSSILSIAAYAALAEAVTQGDGSLIQAQFFNPADIGTLALDRIAPRTQEAIIPYLESYGTLPPYELALVADRQEGADQVAIMALVYADEATATQAAEELTNRVASFPRLANPNNPVPMIEDEDVNGSMDAPSVYFSEAANRWIAVAAVRYPFPTEGVAGPVPLPPSSGALMRYWIQERDRSPLLPLLIETGLE